MPPKATLKLEPSPAGEVDDQGPPQLHLYTYKSQNGYKIPIMLEELREAYPVLAKSELSYDVCNVDLKTGIQKQAEFLKINPVGKIPALVDDNADGLHLFESGSIALWLMNRYDKEHRLSFSDPHLQAEMTSWIAFGSALAAQQGQLNNFFKRQQVKDPFAIRDSYNGLQDLYRVLEGQFAEKKRKWLVGDKFSFADLAVFPSIVMHTSVGMDVQMFPNLTIWSESIYGRPAVKLGLQVPEQLAEHNAEDAREQYAVMAKYLREADEEDGPDKKRKKTD